MPRIIPEAKLPYLIEWLVQQLDPITDAEPATLAEYVVALLKHEKNDEEGLKRHCQSQLEDFLREHTRSFVDNLFAAMKGI
jgi:RNA-binding protein 26